MAQELLQIKVDNLHPDPDQPRHDFDGTPAKEVMVALKSLSENIAQFGVLEPLLVRKGPGRWDYFILAGERRWRASKMAGLERVPCLLQEDLGENDEEIRLVKQLSENIQRENLSPLDIAKSLKKALDTFNVSQRNLAKALGKHESWVSRHLQMLVAEGPAKEALESGLIDGYTTFNVLMSLPEDKQREIVEEAKERGDTKIPKSVLSKAANALSKPAAPAGHYLTEQDKQGTNLSTSPIDWETGAGLPDNSFEDFTRPAAASTSKRAATNSAGPEVHVDTRLHLSQAKRLLELLGAEVPRDEFFVATALIEAMRKLPGA